MKNIKSIVFVGVVLPGVVAGLLLMKRQPANQTAPPTVEARLQTIATANAALLVPASEAEVEATSPPVSGLAETPIGAGRQVRDAAQPKIHAAARPNEN